MTHSKILSKFLFKRFFMGVGLVLLVVCGIIFSVTFVERLPGYPTALLALNDAWIRLVEYVPLFLPLAVFMGTLVAYYTMTRSSEGIIISGAGLSPYQMARPFLIGAFLIGVFATTVINPYSVKLSSETITSEHLKLVDDSIWLRESSETGYITMMAKTMSKSKDTLIFGNATIYIQDQDFKLVNRITTDKITLSYDGMTTAHAEISDKTGKTVSGPWSTKTLITPQTVLDRYLQPDQISF